MNAYGTDDGFIEWLAAQGLPSPSGDPAVLRQIGSNYIDAAYEARLNCSSRAGGFEQLLAWPRKNHMFNGQKVPNDYIPAAWVNASYRAAYISAVTPGWSASGTDPSRLTRVEKVDVISREFFAPSEVAGSVDIAPGMPFDSVVNALVSPWLCGTGRSPSSLFRVI